MKCVSPTEGRAYSTVHYKPYTPSHKNWFWSIDRSVSKSEGDQKSGDAVGLDLFPVAHCLGPV